MCLSIFGLRHVKEPWQWNFHLHPPFERHDSSTATWHRGIRIAPFSVPFLTRLAPSLSSMTILWESEEPIARAEGDEVMVPRRRGSMRAATMYHVDGVAA